MIYLPTNRKCFLLVPMDADTTALVWIAFCDNPDEAMFAARCDIAKVAA